MQTVHPKIITALKTGYLLNDEQVHQILKIGGTAFITESYLKEVATEYTSTHVKAVLDFIEKFLGNYQHAEKTTNGRELKLSYFSINASGRHGYCVSCSPKEIVFIRITSIEGMASYRRILTQPVS